MSNFGGNACHETSLYKNLNAHSSDIVVCIDSHLNGRHQFEDSLREHLAAGAQVGGTKVTYVHVQ